MPHQQERYAPRSAGNSIPTTEKNRFPHGSYLQYSGHVSLVLTICPLSRKHDLMRNQVLALRDQDVKDLAAYYAAKEPQALAIRKPLTLGEWTARCNRCHGKDGNSTDPRFAVLAGQDEVYLTKALELYHGGERESQLMSAMSFLMSESDIKKLAAYYSLQRKK